MLFDLTRQTRGRTKEVLDVGCGFLLVKYFFTWVFNVINLNDLCSRREYHQVLLLI